MHLLLLHLLLQLLLRRGEEAASWRRGKGGQRRSISGSGIRASEASKAAAKKPKNTYP